MSSKPLHIRDDCHNHAMILRWLKTTPHDDSADWWDMIDRALARMSEIARLEGFKAGQRALKVRMAKYYDASAKPEEWSASLSNAILNFSIEEEAT